MENVNIKSNNECSDIQEVSNNEIYDISNNEKVYTVKESDMVSKQLREWSYEKWGDKYNRAELEKIPFLWTDVDRKQSVSVDAITQKEI